MLSIRQLVQSGQSHSPALFSVAQAAGAVSPVEEEAPWCGAGVWEFQTEEFTITTQPFTTAARDEDGSTDAGTLGRVTITGGWDAEGVYWEGRLAVGKGRKILASVGEVAGLGGARSVARTLTWADGDRWAFAFACKAVDNRNNMECAYKALNNTKYMQVSVLCSVLYATCPYCVVFYSMQSVRIM